MQKIIKMNDLRCLKDTESVREENLKTFNFMQKMQKVNFINFEPNSNKICIFPYSNKGLFISKRLSLYSDKDTR